MLLIKNVNDQLPRLFSLHNIPSPIFHRRDKFSRTFSRKAKIFEFISHKWMVERHMARLRRDNPFLLRCCPSNGGWAAFMDSPVYDFIRSSAVFHFTQIYDRPCTTMCYLKLFLALLLKALCISGCRCGVS